MAAVVFGLADAGKMLLLICCTYIGWTWREKTTVTVCVALSLFCAASFWLDTQGQEVMERKGQAQAWQGAQADLKRLRGQLDRIAETGDAAALMAQAEAAKTRAEAWKAKADEEAKTGRGKRWQSANTAWEKAVTEEAALRGKAGQARRRDALRAELSTAKQAAQASGGPAEISGRAGAAAMLGIEPDNAERAAHIIAMLFCIAVAEMLTWAAIPGASLIRSAQSGGKRNGGRQCAERPAPEQQKQPQRGTRAYYLARLESERPDLAAEVAAGAKSVNAAAIEAGLRKPPKAKAGAKETAAAPKRTVDGTPESVRQFLTDISRYRKKAEVAA